MEVKGTAVRTNPLYVRQRFGSRYDEWLDSMPSASRAIMENKVNIKQWYSLEDALTVPTVKVCDLFYGGDQRAAWEIGRFSAEYALWGLYRLFVRIGSPAYLIKRAGEIFGTYFRPSKITVDADTPLKATVLIEEFSEMAEVIEFRIGGWMERALEISGCSDVQSHIQKSMARGDPVTEFMGEWR